jgi:hypothetical protein
LGRPVQRQSGTNPGVRHRALSGESAQSQAVVRWHYGNCISDISSGNSLSEGKAVSFSLTVTKFAPR